MEVEATERRESVKASRRKMPQVMGALAGKKEREGGGSRK